MGRQSKRKSNCQERRIGLSGRSEGRTRGNIQVAYAVNLAIRIHHALVSIRAHSRRADLVESVPCLLEDASYASICVSVVEFEVPDATAPQRAIQNRVRLYDFFGIFVAKAQPYLQVGQAQRVSTRAQNHLRVSIGRLLCMIMERIPSSSVMDKETRRSRRHKHSAVQDT